MKKEGGIKESGKTKKKEVEEGRRSEEEERRSEEEERRSKEKRGKKE